MIVTQVIDTVAWFAAGVFVICIFTSSKKGNPPKPQDLIGIVSFFVMIAAFFLSILCRIWKL